MSVNPTRTLPLDLPEQFRYTAMIELSSDTQGLHHSFIRHKNEWQQIILFDEALINRLSPVMNEIDRLEAVTATSAQEARQKSRIAREEFRNAFRKLANDVYLDIKTAFDEIEMILYRFVQENVTFDQYIGRHVNSEGHVQLHFKVETIALEPKVMVVCVSDTLFPPVNENERPAKKIITVFFKPWRKDYSKCCVIETKQQLVDSQQK